MQSEDRKLNKYWREVGRGHRRVFGAWSWCWVHCRGAGRLGGRGGSRVMQVGERIAQAGAQCRASAAGRLRRRAAAAALDPPALRRSPIQGQMPVDPGAKAGCGRRAVFAPLATRPAAPRRIGRPGRRRVGRGRVCFITFCSRGRLPAHATGSGGRGAGSEPSRPYSRLPHRHIMVNYPLGCMDRSAGPHGPAGWAARTYRLGRTGLPAKPRRPTVWAARAFSASSPSPPHRRCWRRAASRRRSKSVRAVRPTGQAPSHCRAARRMGVPTRGQFGHGAVGSRPSVTCPGQAACTGCAAAASASPAVAPAAPAPVPRRARRTAAMVTVQAWGGGGEAS